MAGLTACGGSDSDEGSGNSGERSATIAAVQPLTGVGADIGKAQSEALKLGLEDGKSELGVEVQLVEEDTGESNTTALNALQRVLRERPAAMWGPYLGTQILAMRPRLESEGVPMVATSGTRSITQDGNEFVFRWYTHQGLTKNVAANWAIDELGVKRPAILHDSTEYGQVGGKFLAESLAAGGAKPVSTQSLNPTDKDVSGQVRRIMAAKPDAVFVQIIGGATGAVALKALRNTGSDVHIIWGSGIASHSLLDLVSDDEVNGVYANVPGKTPVTRDSDDPGVVDFLERFKERTGREGDLFSLAAYDAGRFFAQAVADGATSPEEMTERLRAEEYDGLLGTYRADEEGNMLHTVTMVEMRGKTPVAVKTYDGPAK